MKKIGLLVVLAACFINAVAQKQSYDFLKGEKEMFIVLDYSVAKLNKKQSNAFFTLKNIEDPDYEAQYRKSMMQILVSDINKYLPSDFIVVPYDKNAKYKLTVKVMTVDDDGDTQAYIFISDIDSHEIKSQFFLEANGGRWGSFANLSGDAMENIACSIGRHLAKRMK